MEIKQYFKELHDKLRQLKNCYDTGLISGQMYAEELNALATTSQSILEEWIRFEEALAQIELPASPAPVSKEWKQGEAFYVLMMFPQAIPLLEQVVEKYPEFDLARLFLAHSYLAVHRLDQARDHLQFLLKTTSVKDVYHLAANGLACLEGSLKAYDLAHHYFQKIDLDQVRKEWKALIVYNHALTLYQLKEFPQCEAKWKTYIRLAPYDWKGYYWLGKTYQEQRKGEEGSVCWMAALQIEEHPQLIKGLARYYEERGMNKVALHFYQRLFRADGRLRDGEGWVGLAWNLGLTKAVDQSRLHFLKAISLFPKETSIQYAYAWMLLYWDQKEEASKVIAKLEKFSPHHPLLQGLKALLEGITVYEREYMKGDKMAQKDGYDENFVQKRRHSHRE